MVNRGTVQTQTIADKLKKVEEDLGMHSLDKENLGVSPLLFVNGRLDRKKYSYIAKNFSILESLNEEVKTLCKGVDLAILNYLIYRGLEAIKINEKFEAIEYAEFESKVK